MENERIIIALDAIDKEFQAEIQELQERIKTLRSEIYNIPELEAKLKNNSFTEKEAAIIDEYNDLRYFGFLQCLQHKQDKEANLKDKTEVLEMFDKNFANMRQGLPTNGLMKFNTSKDALIDNFSNKAAFKKGNFMLTLENFLAIKGFRNSTKKLLDELMIKFTENGANSLIVEIPLKEHMEYRGLKDEKEARKQVNEDLETLFHTSITRNEGDSHDFNKLRIIGEGSIKKGVIRVGFYQGFFELAAKFLFMPMPIAALSFNDNKNPNSYDLARRIALHKFMNTLKHNKNADVISVKSLLDDCPNFANYEDIAKKGSRQYRRYIIEPFERDMNALSSVFTWQYEGISETGKSSLMFDEFIKLNVIIKWLYYPAIENDIKEVTTSTHEKGRPKKKQ